jgi:hypothetical protein
MKKFSNYLRERTFFQIVASLAAVKAPFLLLHRFWRLRNRISQAGFACAGIGVLLGLISIL